jgi:hypothetical protein
LKYIDQWIEYLNGRVHLGQQCQQYTKVIKTSKYNYFKIRIFI